MGRRGVASLSVVSLLTAMVVALGGVAEADGPAIAFARTDYPTGVNPWAVEVGDVNEDSHPDLLTADGNPSSSESLSVLLGDGAGGFGPKTTFTSMAEPTSLAVGDLNGDAHLDVAMVNGIQDLVGVLYGDGTGAFGPGATIELSDGFPSILVWAVALGDVNGDGHVDVLTVNLNADTIAVVLADGAGGFGAPTQFGVGDRPNALTTGDVNGDGDLDVVTSNAGDSSVSVLLGDGVGGFAAPFAATVDTGPVAVAVGDVNGDAKLDAVTTSGTAGTASILLGDGSGHLEPAPTVPVVSGQRSQDLVLGDLNGDSLADLAVALEGSSTTSPVAILTGDGSGGFSSSTNVLVAGFPRSVAMADLNDDARADLVTSSFSSSTVSVLLNGVAPRSIVATPDAALVDGQVIEVTGSGWQPGHQVGFCQSVPAADPGPQNCADGLYTQLTVEGDGTFTSSLTVRRTIFVPSLGDDVDCVNASPQCVVGAADGSNVAGTVVTAPLTFALVEPDAPTILRNAVAGHESATVAWTAPRSQGGSPVTAYVVTPYVGYSPRPSTTFDASATTRVVTGLVNGTQYRFRVQAVNAHGTSAYSKVTNAVTPAATAPGAPTILRNAVAGHESATVAWTPPPFDGGSPVTGYVVTPYVGYSPRPSTTFDASATTRVVMGLVDGTQYRFRVQAINAIGTSGYSKVTNPVVPA